MSVDIICRLTLTKPMHGVLCLGRGERVPSVGISSGAPSSLMGPAIRQIGPRGRVAAVRAPAGSSSSPAVRPL